MTAYGKKKITGVSFWFLQRYESSLLRSLKKKPEERAIRRNVSDVSAGTCVDEYCGPTEVYNV